jgi:hypothetical protein
MKIGTRSTGLRFNAAVTRPLESMALRGLLSRFLWLASHRREDGVEVSGRQSKPAAKDVVSFGCLEGLAVDQLLAGMGHQKRLHEFGVQL